MKEPERLKAMRETEGSGSRTAGTSRAPAERPERGGENGGQVRTRKEAAMETAESIVREAAQAGSGWFVRDGAILAGRPGDVGRDDPVTRVLRMRERAGKTAAGRPGPDESMVGTAAAAEALGAAERAVLLLRLAADFPWEDVLFEPDGELELEDCTREELAALRTGMLRDLKPVPEEEAAPVGRPAAEERALRNLRNAVADLRWRSPNRDRTGEDRRSLGARQRSLRRAERTCGLAAKLSAAEADEERALAIALAATDAEPQSRREANGGRRDESLGGTAATVARLRGELAEARRETDRRERALSEALRDLIRETREEPASCDLTDARKLEELGCGLEAEAAELLAESPEYVTALELARATKRRRTGEPVPTETD